MAGSQKTLYAVVYSALLMAAACGDNPQKNPPEDAGVDPEPDAAKPPPSNCCEDEACTKVAKGACEEGELCGLDSVGKDGTCTSDCPVEQACGSLCCPWGASCEDEQCVLSDLSVEVDPSVWPYPVSTIVGESDCMAIDSCVGEPGRYTLLETGIRVKNAGKAAFKLPGVTMRDDMDVSFCQGSYLMRDFVKATIKDGNGKVVRESDLPTLCKAEGDDYVCAVSGLEPGKKIDLPKGTCNQLDVTGLPKGEYRVDLEVNPKRVVGEKRFDNNVASYTFSHSGCDGFQCGGTCCPPDVVCVDGKCAMPNLVVRKDTLRDSIHFTGRDVEGDVCSGEDRCTLELGNRRLLAFETRIENVGGGNLSLGDVVGNPLLVEGCDGQAIVKDLVRYRLLDSENKVVVEAHERNLCLTDMEGAGGEGPSDPNTQPWDDAGCASLSAGSSTIYGAANSCQWVDVTGLKAGKYKLEVKVNPEGMISEENLDDNVVRVEVDVPEAACQETEVCNDDIDQDCDHVPDAWDEDCGGPGPGPDPDPEWTETEGNTSCATPYEVGTKRLLTTDVEGATTTELCGAKGSSAFYAITVTEREIFYADALESGAGTSLVLHGETCTATPVECSDKACGRESGLLALTLEPGRYILEARLHEANVDGVVMVSLERTPAANAQLVREPGVYVGDTSDAQTLEVGMCETGWDEETGESIYADVPGPHDVWVVAHCDTPITASTCGSASFPSTTSVFDRLGTSTYACGHNQNLCGSDPDGFAVQQWGSRGLDYVVVGGQTEGAKGEYQLHLSF